VLLRLLAVTGGVAVLVAVATRGTGAAGLALGTLGLALTGELACLMMLSAREGRLPFGPGDAARRGQGLLVPALAALAAAAAWGLRMPLAAPAPPHSLIVAAILLALAFPMLVAERTVAGLHPAVLPEAPALRALLLLPVLGLALAAAVTAALGAGLDQAAIVGRVADLLVVLIAAELALRALGRWFLPPPAPDAARAAVTSLLAAMLAGSFGQEGVGGPLRSQLGLDFARSWAMRYLRAAALPALVLTALFCWGLTGVTAIGLDQRGVYERFGAPVAVLRPGLHLALPWPLGRVRRVEFGVVHATSPGGEAGATPPPPPAEAPPPASADRLWDTAHPGEVTYLIASESQGRQGFQTVNADLLVLWRIGLTDADARRAVYGTTDPQTLVREVTGRRLARFFASRTLDAVLGERRETMAETLRSALAADLAPLDSGIEILDVLIEAVHPPAGAAAAYHAVQAAAIQASASIAAEQGRARRTENQALLQAHRLTTIAEASAGETVHTANAEAIRFAADRAAAAAGGRAFLLERYLADLSGALATVPLTIIDNRLDSASAPLIDLRPLAAPGTPPPEDSN
jgi:regulator of protease activity HflC (stomatin/prohibitin superfamily)